MGLKKSSAARNKVVFVGMCQSGSLSPAAAVMGLGYHSWGFHRPAFKNARNGDYRLLDNFVDQMDSLRDYPFNIYYDRILCRYPKTRFILTYRTDLDHWFDKLQKYTHEDLKHTMAHSYWWSKETLEESDRERCKDIHEQHCKRVRRVIPANQLLEWSVDIPEHNTWQRICGFLREPIPVCVPLPVKKDRSTFIRHMSKEYRINWGVWEDDEGHEIVNVARDY